MDAEIRGLGIIFPLTVLFSPPGRPHPHEGLQLNARSAVLVMQALFSQAGNAQRVPQINRLGTSLWQ